MANVSPVPLSPAQSLRKSSRIVAAAQVATQLAGLAMLAVLYRRLGVQPYGLIALVAPLLALARIVVASGLDTVTIQQAELNDRQISALFWINQALGWGMALVTAACAPLLVWFYKVPEVGPVTVALAGTSVAFVLGTQHQALLQRRMRLGTLAVIRLASLLLSGLAAIGLALAGKGVWALVTQQYVELAALAVLVWWAEPWRPHWVLRGTGGRRLVGFGGHYTLSNLMAYVATNLDKILVGRILGEIPLALYSQAFNLMTKPVHVLVTPLTGVMLPALSRAVHDRAQYTALLLGFFRFTLLILLPAGVGMAVVAPEAMRVLGGPEWAAAGPILAVLALALPVQACHNLVGSVFASAGHARRLSAASIVATATICAAYATGFAGGWLAGGADMALLGTAAGYTLGMVLVVFPLYLGFALHTVGVPARSWLAQLHPAALATAGMALLVLGTRLLFTRFLPIPDLPLLVIEIGVGVSTYAFFAWRAIHWFLQEGLRESESTAPLPLSHPRKSAAGDASGCDSGS